MKRHLPGLHSEGPRGEEVLQGIFLVRVDRAYYRWHPQKPFFILSFAVLEPQDLTSRKISGRLYATSKALWRLNWFLRDFGYDRDLLGRDEVDEKASARSHRSSANHEESVCRSHLPGSRRFCAFQRMGTYLQGCS